MAGQRTSIRVGSVTADVSLQNVAGKASETRWEVKTVGPDGAPIVEGTAEHVGPLLIDAAGRDGKEVDVSAATPRTTGDDAPSLAPEGVTRDQAEREATAHGEAVEAEIERLMPDPTALIPARPAGGAPIIPRTAEQAIERDIRMGAPAPEMRQARGVTTEAGEFVDLTDQLAEIDKSVKLEGIEIAAAVPASAVPRSRIIGAKFVVPQDETSRQVCKLLYVALKEEARALAVRWSKRTNQAMGIIVASSRHDALILLEVEWAAAERPVPAAAVLTEIATSQVERDAAIGFVRRNAQPATALNELEDDRSRLQAELLAAARAGEVDQFVAIGGMTVDEGDDLAAALGAGS